MKRCNLVFACLLVMSAASGCATLPKATEPETYGNETETTVYEV